MNESPLIKDKKIIIKYMRNLSGSLDDIIVSYLSLEVKNL